MKTNKSKKSPRKRQAEKLLQEKIERNDLAITTLRDEYNLQINRMKNLDTKVRLLLVVATTLSGILFTIMDRIFNSYKPDKTMDILNYTYDDIMILLYYGIFFIAVSLTIVLSIFYYLLKSIHLQGSSRLGNVIDMLEDKNRIEFQVELIQNYQSVINLINEPLNTRINFIKKIEMRMLVLLILNAIISFTYIVISFNQHLQVSL